VRGGPALAVDGASRRSPSSESGCACFALRCFKMGIRPSHRQGTNNVKRPTTNTCLDRLGYFGAQSITRPCSLNVTVRKGSL